MPILTRSPMSDLIRIETVIDGRTVIWYVHRSWYSSYPWKV